MTDSILPMVGSNLLVVGYMSTNLQKLRKCILKTWKQFKYPTLGEWLSRYKTWDYKELVT